MSGQPLREKRQKIKQSERHERTTAFLKYKQALLADNRCFKKQASVISGQPLF